MHHNNNTNQPLQRFFTSQAEAEQIHEAWSKLIYNNVTQIKQVLLSILTISLSESNSVLDFITLGRGSFQVFHVAKI